MYWFPILTTILNLLIVWVMPKRLTRKEIYINWKGLVGLTLFVDLLFGHVFGLYDFIKPGIQFISLITETIQPPLSGLIFLNFMPKKRSKFILYTVVAVAVSCGYESLATHFHYLYYTGWKLWYSAIVYVVVFLYLRWHLKWLRS